MNGQVVPFLTADFLSDAPLAQVVWDGFSECGKAEPARATPARGVFPPTPQLS